MMKKIWSFLLLAGGIYFTACDNNEDIAYQDITVSFAAAETGIDETQSETAVGISLTRTATTDLTVTVSYTTQDVAYGTDFTMVPQPVDNTLTLTIPAGSSSGSFTVEKTAGIWFEGDESITFSITSIAPTSGYRIADNATSVLSFGAIVSSGSELTLEGKSGDVNYANVVYVDFSSNHQWPVSRSSWNLGFYCGADYRVVLNGSYATAAVSTGKTDFSAVTLADAEAAFNDADMNVSATPMSSTGLSLNLVDSFDGSLEGTAIAAIASDDDANPVYFVASENDKSTYENWYKVKINRNGDAGYRVQYARMNETTVQTIDITKDDAYNFIFLSLESGKTVSVEPQAAKWDLMWGYNIGSTSGRPYFMQDMVVINNIGGAKVSEVAVTNQIDSDYEAFDESQLAALSFTDDRIAIGSNWRTTSNMNGATGPLGIKTDRFYVVETPDGYYYKMRFISMGLANDGGERGRPVIRYARVK